MDEEGRQAMESDASAEDDAHCRTVGGAPAAPASNTERRQRIIDEIRRRIVLGDLRPGQRIIEAELTASLDVSRPTAREALNQTARDGFLVQEACRGLRVADIEAGSLLDVARARVALDTEAITEILADDAGGARARLEAVWKRFEDESAEADPVADYEAHLRFHRGIWEASGNYLLMRIWPVVEAQMTIILAYDEFTRRDKARAHAIHAALMSAIRSGDMDRIRTALDVHTMVSAQELALLVSG